MVIIQDRVSWYGLFCEVVDSTQPYKLSCQYLLSTAFWVVFYSSKIKMTESEIQI